VGSYIGVNDVPTSQVIQVAVDISRGRIATMRMLHIGLAHPEGAGSIAAAGHRVTNDV